MLIVGCLLAFVASVARTWGALNYRRDPIERALVFYSASVQILVVLVSAVLGIIGSILIALSTSAVLGLVAFVVFWFSPRLLAPILEVLGL